MTIKFKALKEFVHPYTFAMEWREVVGDRGWTLHVYGPVNSKSEEILRFDCFEVTPHYHLGWSYRNEKFVEIEAPNPLDWTFDNLRSSFADFAAMAGADAAYSDHTLLQMSAAIDRLQTQIHSNSAELP